MRFRSKTLKDIVEISCALLYGLFSSLVRRGRRRVVIYYHGLKKNDIGRFDKQMSYLARHCRVLTPSDLVTASPNGSEAMVSMTFDDAFTSFDDNALPILQKYRLPAAISVPTGNLGQPPNWTLEDNCPDVDEVVMGEENIARLDKLGFEVLSHTVSHRNLTDLDGGELKKELERSKQTLEQIVGHTVPAISYPHGAYNAKICKAAEQAGYQVGFSIEPYSVDDSPDNFRLGRFVVSPADSMLKFKLKVKGAYQVVKYLRRLKRTLVRP